MKRIIATFAIALFVLGVVVLLFGTLLCSPLIALYEQEAE